MANDSETPNILLGWKSRQRPQEFRDGVFHRLHDDFLKSRGHTLRSNRSEIRTPPITRAVLLLSSRWNESTQVRFDVRLKVAHDKYNPWAQSGARSGVGLKDVGLLEWGVAGLAGVPRQMWMIDASTDKAGLEAQIRDAFCQFGLPLLDRMSTLEGVVSLYAERGCSAGYIPRSWALLQLGRRDEAIQVVEAEVDMAPHEKAKSFAEALLNRIRRNEEFLVGA